MLLSSLPSQTTLLAPAVRLVVVYEPGVISFRCNAPKLLLMRIHNKALLPSVNETVVVSPIAALNGLGAALTPVILPGTLGKVMLVTVCGLVPVTVSASL